MEEESMRKSPPPISVQHTFFKPALRYREPLQCFHLAQHTGDIPISYYALYDLCRKAQLKAPHWY